MNMNYITTYACTGDSNIEHIWKRKIAKRLERSLCGMLSDGVNLLRNDDSIPCALCERVQRAIELQERETDRHD